MKNHWLRAPLTSDVDAPYSELHDLYRKPDIMRIVKSRRLRWAGHVTRMGNERGAWKLLVGKPEGKCPVGRPRMRWENNINREVHSCGASGSMRACHAAGPGSIPGRDKFPGWGFSGFFLTCKTNIRKLYAHKVPEYHLAIIIIHHHFITGANDLRCWRALKPKYT